MKDVVKRAARGAAFGLVVLALSGKAWAVAEGEGAPASVAVPKLETRAFGGIAQGVSVAGSLFNHRLRLEVWEGLILGKANGHYSEGALQARLLGTPDNALWVRVGFQRIAKTLVCYDRPNQADDARAIDVGGAYRYRSLSGHLVVAELGVESLGRDQSLGCSDGGVDANSSGVRASLLGQIAVGHGLGLFGRVGLRTADHLLEIHVLPELFGGVAFEL